MWFKSTMGCMKKIELTDEELKLLVEVINAVAVGGPKVRLLASIMAKLDAD